MTKYFDEEGKPVEGIPTKEELEALQAKAQEAEEKAKELEKLQAELEENKSELEKLQSKDFNFDRFRKSTEKQKREMLEDFTEKEQALIREQESLRNEHESLKGALYDEHKNRILDNLAGTDRELRERIEEASKQLVGETKTPQQIAEKYTNAFILVKGSRPSVNPLNAYYPATEQIGTPPKGRYTDTPEGKENLKRWLPNINWDKK